MKKILLATTTIASLGLAAGANAFDVKVGGYYTNGFATTDTNSTTAGFDDVQTMQDLEFEVKGSQELDNGIKVYFDIEVDSTSGNNARYDDISAGFKGSFGDLRFGNFDSDEMVDGLFPTVQASYEWDLVKAVTGALPDTSVVYDSDYTSVGYKSPSISGFTAAVQYFDLNEENVDTREVRQNGGDAGVSTDGSEGFSVGAGYKGNMGDFSFSIGAAHDAIPSADQSETTFGAGVGFSGFSIQATGYTRETSETLDADGYALVGSYKTGPWAIMGGYGSEDRDTSATVTQDLTSYYVAGSYAMGPGVGIFASVNFGENNPSNAAATDATVGGVGFKVSF